MASDAATTGEILAACATSDANPRVEGRVAPWKPGTETGGKQTDRYTQVG